MREMLLALFVALPPIILSLAMWWVARRTTDRMLREFVEIWPEGCPICAYHRFGVMHGHVDPHEEPRPAPHQCKERP